MSDSARRPSSRRRSVSRGRSTSSQGSSSSSTSRRSAGRARLRTNCTNNLNSRSNPGFMALCRVVGISVSSSGGITMSPRGSMPEMS